MSTNMKSFFAVLYILILTVFFLLFIFFDIFRLAFLDVFVLVKIPVASIAYGFVVLKLWSWARKKNLDS